MVLTPLVDAASALGSNFLENAKDANRRGGDSVRRPNILFLCSDQHSGAVVSANGHPIVKTPHLDRLAAAGTNFQTAYCGSAVCAPARAGLMTGMFPSDVRSYCNSTPFDGDGLTWATRLRNAGYHCWATGKLDLWKGRDLGFTELDTIHEHSEDPDVSSLFRSPLCSRSEERDQVKGSFNAGEHEDAQRAQNGIDHLHMLQQAAGQNPWCMWIGFYAPHPPFKAKPEYEQMYPPDAMPLAEWPDGYLERRHPAYQMQANYKNMQLPIAKERQLRARAAYFGMITEMDRTIGRILDALEQTGQRENTIIIYTSDHGEMLGEHGLWLKETLLDYASRIPIIVAGPGIPQSKVVRDPIGHVDLVATLMELAGAETSGLRGRSLMSTMNGRASEQPAYAYSESHSAGNATGSFMIRRDKWKYIYFTGADPLLFDMSTPFGEFTNLAKDNTSIVEELHAHLTSVVSPDQITFEAFRRQDEVLQGIIHERSTQEFYKSIAGRLGSIQATTFAERYYSQWN
jgi:choline-sulfatase